MTSPDLERGEPPSGDLLGTTGVPGLVRLTVTTAWRALAQAAGTALQTSSAMLTRTLQGDPPLLILHDLAGEIRGNLAAALGGYDDTGPAPTPRRETGTLDDLKARGAALLDRSAD